MSEQASDSSTGRPSQEQRVVPVAATETATSGLVPAHSNNDFPFIAGASPSSASVPASSSLASSVPSTPAPSSSSPSAVDSVTSALSSLAVSPSTTTVSNSETLSDPSENATKTEEQEELSPEEAALKKQGLKSTHRPGFYVHIDSPRRLRIQTKSKTFDLDRYCPHANADLLKWGVLRTDMTLRCGLHYWGFDLVKNGQCIAHPDETLNACQVPELEW